ncbi:MAG: helix-turn-helix domain-containing protein [Paludibacteraceae bacterium]
MNFESFPLHYKEDFLLIDSEQQSFSLNKPYSLNNYAMATLIERGSLDLLINGIFSCHIQEPGIVYHLPQQIFVIRDISPDFSGKHIMLSSTFIAHLGLDITIDLPWQLQQHPFLPLNGQAVEAVENLYTMCAGVLQQPTNPYQLQILQHIMQAYFLSFNYYFHSQLPAVDQPTRAQKLTQQFFALLRQHALKEHGVQFYADKLHITSKYLTYSVKQATGRSAKQCIDHYLLARAQYLLTSMNNADSLSSVVAQLNIAEVAYELGFPDPTTFSRYFYMHMGVRPKEWRKCWYDKQHSSSDQ